MAKKQPIKRIIDSTGKARYYQGGKRLTASKGSKAWLRSEPEIGPRTRLTQAESDFLKRSLASKKSASQRLRFDGKFVDKLYQEVLKNRNLPSKGEVKKAFPSVKDFGDFQKTLQNIVGKKSRSITQDSDKIVSYTTPNQKRARTSFESVVDIIESLQTSPVYQLMNFVVVTRDGRKLKGTAAMEYIRDWETDMLSKIMRKNKKVAFVRFNHLVTPNVIDKEIEWNEEEQPKPEEQQSV